MSDGPYKSLPMKPRWRRVAKCAYKEAFATDEIADNVARACHADWRSEIRPALVATIAGILAPSGQQRLFADQVASDLRGLQRNCSSPMEAMLVKSSMDAVRSGLGGENAVRQAAEDVLSDRGLNCYRQVEEHVRRDDSLRSAAFVRTRFSEAHGKVDFAGLADALIGKRPAFASRARASYSDLDAGVSLP